MSNVWIRIIIGSLLMVHGFAHWHMTSGWDSNLTDRSWLLAAAGIAPAAIHPIATLLWVAALLAFLCSGGAVLGSLAIWRSLTVVAAVASLTAMILFWRAALIFGAATDTGILVALVWAGWPSVALVR